MDKIKIIEAKYLKTDVTKFNVGDTVRVLTKIKEEGDRIRLHPFEGVVISLKGSGIRESFTVRKVSSGEGIERVFPVHSPVIDRIEIVRSGVVRRAKLYYLRGKVGKHDTKIKAKEAPSQVKAKAKA